MGALLVSYSGRFILQYIGLGQISIITLACLSIRSDGIECQFDWHFWVEFGWDSGIEHCATQWGKLRGCRKLFKLENIRGYLRIYLSLLTPNIFYRNQWIFDKPMSIRSQFGIFFPSISFYLTFIQSPLWKNWNIQIRWFLAEFWGHIL